MDLHPIVIRAENPTDDYCIVLITLYNTINAVVFTKLTLLRQSAVNVNTSSHVGMRSFCRLDETVLINILRVFHL